MEGIDHVTVRGDGNMDLVIRGRIGEGRETVGYRATGVSIAIDRTTAEPQEWSSSRPVTRRSTSSTRRWAWCWDGGGHRAVARLLPGPPLTDRLDRAVLDNDPDRRGVLLEVLTAALDAVDPAAAVRAALGRDEERLTVAGRADAARWGGEGDRPRDGQGRRWYGPRLARSVTGSIGQRSACRACPSRPGRHRDSGGRAPQPGSGSLAAGTRLLELAASAGPFRSGGLSPLRRRIVAGRGTRRRAHHRRSLDRDWPALVSRSLDQRAEHGAQASLRPQGRRLGPPLPVPGCDHLDPLRRGGRPDRGDRIGTDGARSVHLCSMPSPWSRGGELACRR